MPIVLSEQVRTEGDEGAQFAVADGTSEEERLTVVRAGSQTPGSWSPDGDRIAYSEAAEKTGSDIWAPTGSELFYLERDAMMAVAVTTTSADSKS